MSSTKGTILFAGGGTGGHIFPAIAIAERLAELAPQLQPWFACSSRPLDSDLLEESGYGFTPLPVRPLPTRPWHAPTFLKHYVQARKQAARLLREQNVKAVVAMGGFVSGPVVAAARKLNRPTMLVNLDAVPGKANRWLAGSCDRLYSVYPSDALPQDRLQLISMPLRQSSLSGGDVAADRRTLGLEPDRPVLLITGASQGATSINQALAELAGRAEFRQALGGWQVLHLAGQGGASELQQAYGGAGIEATVLEFCHQMGAAWGAAELALSRAGAGSVAEAAANAVPTLFLPYSYHKDQHQKRNAQPLVDEGGALLIEDTIDPAANADRLIEPLCGLLRDSQRRSLMRKVLQRHDQADGARQLAEAAVQHALGTQTAQSV